MDATVYEVFESDSESSVTGTSLPEALAVADFAAPESFMGGMVDSGFPLFEEQPASAHEAARSSPLHTDK